MPRRSIHTEFDFMGKFLFVDLHSAVATEGSIYAHQPLFDTNAELLTLLAAQPDVGPGVGTRLSLMLNSRRPWNTQWLQRIRKALEVKFSNDESFCKKIVAAFDESVSKQFLATVRGKNTDPIHRAKQAPNSLTPSTARRILVDLGCSDEQIDSLSNHAKIIVQFLRAREQLTKAGLDPSNLGKAFGPNVPDSILEIVLPVLRQ